MRSKHQSTGRLLPALAFAIALTSPALAGGNQPYIEGDQLPFAFLDLEGRTVRSSDPEFQGRVLLIDLWATWCPPCVKEMPSIQALADAFAEESVRFLLVSQEDVVTVQRFAEQQQYTLPFARADSAPPEAFDSDDLVPATFILDRSGRVVYKHVGFRDWNAPAVHDFLRGLLDGEV